MRGCASQELEEENEVMSTLVGKPSGRLARISGKIKQWSFDEGKVYCTTLFFCLSFLSTFLCISFLHVLSPFLPHVCVCLTLPPSVCLSVSLFLSPSVRPFLPLPSNLSLLATLLPVSGSTTHTSSHDLTVSFCLLFLFFKTSSHAEHRHPYSHPRLSLETPTA